MTPDEFNALPTGTELLIRASKYGNEIDSDGDVVLNHKMAGDDDWSYFALDSIECIAPPKPLAVGDKVRCSANAHRLTIIALDGAEAWTIGPNGHRLTYPLNSIIRA